MTETQVVSRGDRSIWTRAILMLVMALAFQLSASLLALVAIAQLILSIDTGESNPRLASLGRKLGQYLLQIARYETFASDEPPFPFSDWPTER